MFDRITLSTPPNTRMPTRFAVKVLSLLLE
jgi:hypothetical protein